MKPELSIIIPTHNKLPLLKATLDALSVQDLSAELWEVVVVDDASTDGTSGWLQEACPVWDGRLRTQRADQNVGRARARNLGASKALGRWLLFLDDDIVAPPGLLSAHHLRLKAHPDHGVIGLVETDPALIDAPHFHYIDSRGVAKCGGTYAPAKYLVTQNTSIPAEAFRIAGGFDERFSAYGFEDMELGFRLEESQGIRFFALREPVPLHVHHHDLESYLKKKLICTQGSLQLLAESHPRRLREMKLDLIVGRSKWRRRWLASLAEFLKSVVAVWPTRKGKRPYFFTTYCTLMDILILATYCQGGILHDRKRIHSSGRA